MTIENNTVRAATQAQINRINALIDRSLISINEMPTTSWEASCIIRNAPASKRDKEHLKNTGGRVLTRMTCGELEMSTKVLEALALLGLAKTHDAKVHEAVALLRAHFTSNKQQ